jgi:glycosyltransferase involved in cell wall biosynthesis
VALPVRDAAGAAEKQDRIEAQSLDTGIPIVLFADEWGGIGGTAGYVVMLGRELKRRGYRVAAFCHDGPGTEAMRTKLASCGVEVLLIPAASGPSMARRVREILDLARMLRRYRAGILALMMGYFTRGGSATIAGRIAGMRAIVRADLTPPEPPVSRLAAASMRLKDRITDGAVVGAIENIAAFRRETGRSVKRMSVIHTGVELERFQPGAWRREARLELGFDATTTVIGTVARLDDERKGIRDFLRACAIASRDAPDARFLIVGDGIHRPVYEALAGELGIAELVRFTGWRSDVPRLLDAMDVFVMSSTFEGGPTSVLEAMAMAKATVSTNVGMVPEVIDDGWTGLIVPAGDFSAMASAMRRLIDDPVLRSDMGSRARERALASLGIERMADDYLNLFAGLIG